MGLAASLFYDLDKEKQTLYRRITPSDAQIEEQQTRWNDLSEHLLDDLAKRSGHSMRSWLQGSYKFATQIRPPKVGDEFDIDLGVYFEWEGDADDGEHEPADLKAMVQQSLSTYEAEDVIEVMTPPKARCSRIRFEGDFHIDVPCYHLDPKRDARSLATEEDGWENSDPKAIYLWFKNLFDDDRRATARRLVKYLKCWAGLTFSEADRPSSILLTVVAAEALDKLSDAEIAEDDDALHNVLVSVVSRLEDNPSVKNPVHDGEVLSDRMTEDQRTKFLDELRAFRNTAEEALDADSVVAAADLWSKPFGQFFPLPEIEDDDLAKSMAVAPILPDVRVTATLKGTNTQWTDMNKIGPIPKNCSIRFDVVGPGCIRPGDVVEWMVRNEGAEAEYTNDLGHRAGLGLSVSRDSKYKGTHYMDCMVRRRGALIAVRRIPVMIGGAFVRRNPLSRPAWTRLRGRR